MKILQKKDVEYGDLSHLTDPKALPIGKREFNEWSERIIKVSKVEASERSLKQTLAVMLMHLGPTEAYKEDGYFALCLRKAAVQETAHAMMMEYQEEIKKERAEDTAPKLAVVDGILEDKGV